MTGRDGDRMAEYIEREAAIDRLEKLFQLQASTARAIIEAIPAADVAPVRHGRWIKANGSWATPGGDPVWECSECGKGRHVYGIEHEHTEATLQPISG